MKCSKCGQERPLTVEEFQPGMFVRSINKMSKPGIIGVVCSSFVNDAVDAELNRKSPLTGPDRRTRMATEVRYIGFRTGSSYSTRPENLEIIHGYMHVYATPGVNGEGIKV